MKNGRFEIYSPMKLTRETASYLTALFGISPILEPDHPDVPIPGFFYDIFGDSTQNLPFTLEDVQHTLHESDTTIWRGENPIPKTNKSTPLLTELVSTGK